MKVKIGDRVMEDTGYGYHVRTIKDRTDKTIRTELNSKGRLYNFRFIDDNNKAQRILNIEKQREVLRLEARELYKSMSEIE
jgi:hypothetical protein